MEWADVQGVDGSGGLICAWEMCLICAWEKDLHKGSGEVKGFDLWDVSNMGCF